MKITIFYVFIFLSSIIVAQDYNKLDADGKRHGKWLKKYDGTDQTRYEGTFEHGKEVGEFKFYKPTSGDIPTAIKIFSKDNDSVLVKYYSSKGKVISQGKMIGKIREGDYRRNIHQNKKSRCPPYAQPLLACPLFRAERR